MRISLCLFVLCRSTDRGLKWMALFLDDRRQSRIIWIEHGQLDSTSKWGVSPASHSHFCDANACHISRCIGTGRKFWVILGPPPLSQQSGPTSDHLAALLFDKEWHCLWQMYFLMKVWGQRVPSKGWRSINNYLLQSFWQFFQHPSSTPTAPFLSIHIVCLLDYRQRAKPFYRLLGSFY